MPTHDFKANTYETKSHKTLISMGLETKVKEWKYMP